MFHSFELDKCERDGLFALENHVDYFAELVEVLVQVFLGGLV